MGEHAATGAPADERQLIERSQQGDLEAFNVLVTVYQDRVYNLCARMLGSREAAEDATQETFVSAFRNVGRIRGEGMRAWLLRIASNTCIDEIRRRQRQRQVSINAPVSDDAGSGRAFDIADPEAGPEEEALRGEAGEMLQAELMRLPEDQRLAILLCDVEGMSYDEIGRAMKCSVGTVKSRISRGREKLRAALQGRPELFGDVVRQRK
jgi:RNA polymerase sigma-70 factor (ECF subfamily)